MSPAPTSRAATRAVRCVLGVVVYGVASAGLLSCSAGDGARPAPPPAAGRPSPQVPAAVRAAASAVPAEARSLPGASGAGRPPTRAAVAAALAGPLGDAGLGPAAGVHALVVDAATGTVLADRAAAAPVTPASTLKTLTAAAALQVLGPATRPRTRVLATAAPGPDGVLAGDLVVVGGGDQTLTSAVVARTGQARVDDLVNVVLAAGVRRVRGRVLGDGSAFTGPALAPGWRPGYVTGGSVAPVTALEVDGGRPAPGLRPGPRVVSPAGTAAADVLAGLRAANVAVTGDASAGPAPAGAVELGGVDGLTVGEQVEQMLAYSDNDLAEALGRLVAQRAGLAADSSGAARAVTDAVASLGVPVTGLQLFDTSGLSVQDRVPGRTLVALVRLAVTAGHPVLRPVALELPLAGRTGTLAERFRAGPARLGFSRVRAKTGALDGVSTLTGWVVSGGGRLLVFSFASEAVPARSAAEAALDRAAAALVAVR